MQVTLDGDPKEIAALVLALQEQQLSELSEKVVESLADGLNQTAASVRIPE